MDMDSFDPSSLLELAMEESDGPVVNSKVAFEAPEFDTNQNALSEEQEMINLEPVVDLTEYFTADQNFGEQATEQMDTGTTNSELDNQKETAAVEPIVPVAEEQLGVDNMCSVPISMFHLFNLDDIFDEQPEVEKKSEIQPKKTEIPVKKLLPVTYSEKTFRKNLFKNAPDTIKLFKLHCTVCSKHIGTSPNVVEKMMRVHRDLNVIVCRNCFDFYGNGNFPIEEGSEIYCEWCGQGGTIFCCSNCPKVFCESCIILNFGIDRRNQIEVITTWTCFACNPAELWPHRALTWGLQKYVREIRSKLPELQKEERQIILSKDISDCCSKSDMDPTLPLPPKIQLQKVPVCLFANKYTKTIVSALKENLLPVVKNQSIYFRKTLVNGPMNRTAQVNMPQNPMVQSPILNQSLSIPQTVKTNLVHARQGMPGGNLQHALQGTPRNNLQHGLQSMPGSNLQYALQGMPGRSPNVTLPSVEVINLIDDNEIKPSTFQTSFPPAHLDLTWLQKAVKESSHCLFNFQSLLNQFDLVSGKLRTDIDQVELFTNKLHSLFAITISSLKLIDDKMLENLKTCKAPKIRTYPNITFIRKTEASKLPPPQRVAPQPVVVLPKVPIPVTNSFVPLRVPVIPSAVPVHQTGPEPASEEEDLSCLLFCETVMTEARDGNKENEFNTNNNFVQKDARLPAPRPVPNHVNSRKRKLQTTKQSMSTSFPTIIVDDDEPPPKLKLTKLQYKFYYKKFNLKPCKVLLSRCDAFVK